MLTLFILLDTAHVLSPIVRAWSTPDLRRLMRLPVTLFICCIAVGMTSWSIAIQIYLVFNFWHFSMQNFGIFQLVRFAPRVNMPLAFGLTAVGVWFAPIAVSVNHWIMDIGLSARAVNRWWFLVVLFALAPVAFLWDRAPWLWPQLEQITLVPRTSQLNSFLVSLRLALGIYHFDLSRWVWRYQRLFT